jgi:hypothetical protein
MGALEDGFLHAMAIAAEHLDHPGAGAVFHDVETHEVKHPYPSQAKGA